MEFNNSDIGNILGSYQLEIIDSLKYIYELFMLNNLVKRDFDQLSNSTKLIKHKQILEILLLTGKNYYEYQPNYDLGAVGKYLGISRNAFALVLAIISL